MPRRLCTRTRVLNLVVHESDRLIGLTAVSNTLELNSYQFSGARLKLLPDKGIGGDELLSALDFRAARHGDRVHTVTAIASALPPSVAS